MKLIRSCQDKKTQAFLVLLLSLLFFLQSRALTAFPGFSTGHFLQRETWGIQNLLGSSPHVQSHRYLTVSSIPRSRSDLLWPGTVKRTARRASRVICHRCHACRRSRLRALLSGTHGGCGHGAGQVLRWCRSGLLMEALEWNVRCGKQKREQSYSFQPLMKVHVFYLPINTFFNCFLCMESKEGAESPGRMGQGSGCASVKFDTGVRQEGGLTFAGSVGR